eukprot:7440570-Pyramimonas_sp.AAC.1
MPHGAPMRFSRVTVNGDVKEARRSASATARCTIGRRGGSAAGASRSSRAAARFAAATAAAANGAARFPQDRA